MPMEIFDMITLDKDAVRKVLPHRCPFVHIDEVFDLVPGKSAKAFKYLDPEDPIFLCHFPGNPIYPGVLLIEAAAQLAFVVFSYRPGAGPGVGGEAGYLGSVKNFTFKETALPGMRLIVSLEMLVKLGNAAKVSVHIGYEGKSIAQGELYFTIDAGDGRKLL